MQVTRRKGDRSGTDNAQETFRLLAARPAWQREKAAETLQLLRPGLASLALRALLADKSRDVRRAAARVASQVASRQDEYALRLALHDPDWVVRCDIVTALSTLGNASARRLLLQALRDEHPMVRYYTAQAIARIGDPRDKAPLLRALESEPAASAQVGILSALYQLGDTALFDRIVSYLANDDYHVKCQVLSAIEYAGNSDALNAMHIARELAATAGPRAVTSRARDVASSIEDRLNIAGDEHV